MRGYSIFLHSTVQARGASLNFKELHGHLPFHRQAREARVLVEAEDEAYRQGHQGFRGVSTPSHRRLSQQISQLYRVRFCYLAYRVRPQIEVDTDETFEDGPVCIVDSRDQVLRHKTVRLVLVLWHHYGVEESTWECEDTMRATYPFLFRDEGTWFSRL